MLDKVTKQLTIGKAEDTSLRFRVRNKDKTVTTPIASEYRFYVQNKPDLTLAPVVDPQDPTSLVLLFNESYAVALGSKVRDFQLVRTVGDRSQVFLAGTVVAGGFAL